MSFGPVLRVVQKQARGFFVPAVSLLLSFLPEIQLLGKQKVLPTYISNMDGGVGRRGGEKHVYAGPCQLEMPNSQGQLQGKEI